MKKRTEKSLTILTLIILFPILSFAQEIIVEDNYNNIPPQHELADIVDENDLNSAYLFWERLTSLNSHIRFTSRNLNGNDFPYQMLRARFNKDNYSIGTLVQRDTGEKDFADLKRIYLKYSRDNAEIILGDFRVDCGLNWTVASKASWSFLSSSYPSTYKWKPSISPNLSTEEGHGWKGAAFHYNGDSSPLLNTKWSFDSWAGIAPYDARQDENNDWLPYSNQGNHGDSDGGEVQESTLGSYLKLKLGNLPLTIGAIINYSRFDKDLAPSGQNVRFGFAKNDFVSNGLTLDYLAKDKSWQFFSELSRQENEALGGSALLIKNQENSKILLRGWHADSGFSTLHSRPDLPFGTNPVGKTGGQVEYVFHYSPSMDIRSSYAIEFKSDEEIADTDKRDSRFSLQCSYYLEKWDFSMALFNRSYWDIYSPEGYGEDLYKGNKNSMKFQILRRNDRSRIRLKSDIKFTHKKPAALFALGYKNNYFKNFAFSLETNYLNNNPDNLTFSVIEAKGPGEFPFTFISGERLRFSSALTANVFNGIKLWINGYIDHNLDGDINEDKTDRQFSLGLEWRFHGE